MSKEKVFRDTTLKILSLVFAILLWFYVITEQNPVVPKELVIPVRIVNLDALNTSNLIMLDNPDSFNITLKLKGKKEILDSINQSTISAIADISNYIAVGGNIVPVTVNGIPEGVTINSKSEHSIKINIDKKLIVQKPVSVNITGNPKGGLANLSAVLTPSEVILTGAESIINTIKTIKVDVDIAGAEATVSKNLPVKLLDETGKDVQGIQLNTQSIDVSVPIANTKRVPLQLILEGEPGDGYVIADKQLQPKEILVTGDQQSLDSLAAINTVAQSISSLTNGAMLNVTLDLPAGIQLVNANEQINALIDIQKVVTNTVDISNIEYRNLDQAYYVNDFPGRTIKLVVKGPESLVNDITKNVSLYVELAAAKDGSGYYEIQVDKSPLLEILELEPKSIVLDIKRRE